MKYPSLLILFIMFLIGAFLFAFIPYILPNIGEGRQAALIILSILLTWGCIGIWYNRKG